MNNIPKSIQLIAGRTGREYDQRKNRKGAFWEDRYTESIAVGDIEFVLDSFRKEQIEQIGTSYIPTGTPRYTTPMPAKYLKPTF